MFYFVRLVQQILFVLAENSHMAHLTAGTRLSLSIQVQAGAGFRQQILPAIDIVADQVLHHRISHTIDRPERQAADRADKLLELAGGAGVHGPVA